MAESLSNFSTVRTASAPTLGWTRRFDGIDALHLRIPFGRVEDRAARPLRTVLRHLIRDLRLHLTITPDQALILHPIPTAARPSIGERLGDFAVRVGAETLTALLEEKK